MISTCLRCAYKKGGGGKSAPFGLDASKLAMEGWLQNEAIDKLIPDLREDLSQISAGTPFMV